MKSITYDSKPQKVSQLHVPTLPDVAFQRYLWFLEKPAWKSMYNKCTEQRLTPGRSATNVTWRDTQAWPRAAACGPRGAVAGGKASPGCGVFSHRDRGMSLTRGHCRAIKLRVPNGLWLRLEMGTNGGKMTSQGSERPGPGTLRGGGQGRAAAARGSHIVSG